MEPKPPSPRELLQRRHLPNVELVTQDGRKVRFYDDLGALNSAAVIVPGSLAIVAGSLPPGADASSTNPTGGTTVTVEVPCAS